MLTAEDLQNVNPDFTPEIMEQVDDIIRRYKKKPGALIPVLEECQRIVGYLPLELQDYISQGLNIPGSTVYGVVTFYSFFNILPVKAHKVKVCVGTACYVKGGKAILDRICKHFGVEEGGGGGEGKKFSVHAVRCIGACGLAPAVVVDEDTYGGMTPDKAIKILEKL